MLLVTDDRVEEVSEPLPGLLSAQKKDQSAVGVNLSPSLAPPEQQRDCHHVLGQFASLFSLTAGVTHLCTHDVDTGDSPPVKQKIYRVPEKKQPKKVIWTEACQTAFEALKAAMCMAPVLKAPDFSKEFVVQAYASEHGVRVVLAQLNEEGLDQSVAFISRRLLPREHRWSTIELEAFAVVWTLKKLRH
ncbi:hypothetical protein NDU88_003399 [Pleurodeles waltl]|uniref:Reverse transcriptase/retrotransposon-derived protein RNase H-like domain-containing protein n=1 Tax=Pleurodeles waltl TaxID=8319 RepID=A0AAV7LGZ5_PLEWA|nr:hypothetical protein NDU88_003399 [Pleurodeles waltl]